MAKLQPALALVALIEHSVKCAEIVEGTPAQIKALGERIDANKAAVAAARAAGARTVTLAAPTAAAAPVDVDAAADADTDADDQSPAAEPGADPS